MWTDTESATDVLECCNSSRCGVAHAAFPFFAEIGEIEDVLPRRIVVEALNHEKRLLFC
jgi:hypothetical protein